MGVDVGSQSVKAVLVDPDGVAVGTASSPLTMSYPRAGWAEQDPDTWLQALRNVIGQLQAWRPSAQIDVLALACQVDGLVAMDADGRALRPAIIWLDRRATRETDQLVAAVGRDRLFDLTGLNADASHTAPKMMWLRRHEPEVWERTALLAPVSTYLVAALTGELAQDAANATSTMLYDLSTGTFSAELCDAAGIDPALLPQVLASTDVVGTVQPEMAKRLGLSADCKVIVGTGDEHAASLAAGAVLPGVVADVTGTAEPVTVATLTPVFDAERLVETHRHAVPGRCLIENPGFVSGGSTLWLASEVLSVPQSKVFDLAASVPAGADGVRFLPALSGATAPRWNDRMRGSFAGLSMNHGRGHLARAVLEGCAFALRDIVDRLAAMRIAGDDVRVVGGGARSPLWMQIKADVLGRPVRAVLAPEPTAFGAAMLAGVATGQFKDCDDAVWQAVQLTGSAVDPDPSRVGVYEQAYEEYRSLFDGVEAALT
ncbi:FGGY-family carbohydrate kinase [Kribbella sp. NPDC004536]|uniref:xylulokinase n=1 Tax=Kribbella sp. NPDC004536 TaxID=3364106 RepID=UPI0036880134